MINIERIIVSKVQPRETNVIWLDISEKKPILKVFLSGKWTPVSDETGEFAELLAQVKDQFGEEILEQLGEELKEDFIKNPEGGENGQVLTKTEEGYVWASADVISEGITTNEIDSLF